MVVKMKQSVLQPVYATKLNDNCLFWGADGQKSITKELGRKRKKKKLPHRNPRTVSEHTSGNVHRGQLLEQKLGCIWNMHLRNPVLIVTQSTLEQSFLQFSAKKSVSQNQNRPS